LLHTVTIKMLMCVGFSLYIIVVIERENNNKGVL